MKIKTSAVLLIATALALCGCVSGWSRGKVVVNIHAPSQLDDQPARIYYNGLLGFVTRDRTNMSLTLFRAILRSGWKWMEPSP